MREIPELKYLEVFHTLQALVNSQYLPVKDEGSIDRALSLINSDPQVLNYRLDDDLPIEWAVRHDDPKMVKALLPFYMSQKSSLNIDGTPLLRYVFEEGQAEIAKFLLDNGFDRKELDGILTWHLISRYYRSEQFNLLLLDLYKKCELKEPEKFCIFDPKFKNQPLKKMLHEYYEVEAKLVEAWGTYYSDRLHGRQHTRPSKLPNPLVQGRFGCTIAQNAAIFNDLELLKQLEGVNGYKESLLIKDDANRTPIDSALHLGHYIAAYRLLCKSPRLIRDLFKCIEVPVFGLCKIISPALIFTIEVGIVGMVLFNLVAISNASILSGLFLTFACVGASFFLASRTSLHSNFNQQNFANIFSFGICAGIANFYACNDYIFNAKYDGAQDVPLYCYSPIKALFER